MVAGDGHLSLLQLPPHVCNMGIEAAEARCFTVPDCAQWELGSAKSGV